MYKSKKMLLFHTGFDSIEAPDIHYGRKNADFGQWFFLSDDEEFSKRWARIRKGSSTYINRYKLDTEGLEIKRFERDVEWFDYIFKNRAGHTDGLAGYDVIIGPIANDTIYDTWGMRCLHSCAVKRLTTSRKRKNLKNAELKRN